MEQERPGVVLHGCGRISRTSDVAEGQENGMPWITIVRKQNIITERIADLRTWFAIIMLDAELATVHVHELKFFSPIPFVKTLA